MEIREEERKNDFSRGSIIKNITNLALPMTLAQLTNVLYNIVDRTYMGRILEHTILSLTNLGLCLPIISTVIAFASLFGMGGASLCSIKRGRGNEEEAEQIMGNSFVLTLTTGAVLTVTGLAFERPILYLFRASDSTFPFANQHITIYLLGNVFVMVGLGMSSFINFQGFGKTGMLTALLGAVTNVILDPIFILGFHIGVRGTALVIIISQFLSALWAVKFLTGQQSILRLKRSCLGLEAARVKQIVAFGVSGFTMSITNNIVQVMHNANLQQFGGDLYVGVVMIINSVREVISMPVNGVTNGTQPVMGYNYGAREYKRVKKSAIFMSVVCILYTTVMWGFVHAYPEFFIRIFNNDSEIMATGAPAVQVYYFGFFFMSLQFAGQSVFVALGKPKNAVFFFTFRKVITALSLILILPEWFGLGTTGIFMAESISNLIGGVACCVTMLITVWSEFNGRKRGRKA